MSCYVPDQIRTSAGLKTHAEFLAAHAQDRRTDAGFGRTTEMMIVAATAAANGRDVVIEAATYQVATDIARKVRDMAQPFNREPSVEARVIGKWNRQGRHVVVFTDHWRPRPM